MVRILSIDGGGIRGVIPATILEALEERIQKLTNNPEARLIDYFDFLAGTSTGGIIVSILNTPKSEQEPHLPKFSTKDVLNFYTTKGSSIFKGRWFSRILGSIGLADEKYDVTSLEELLNTKLGNNWLSKMLKPCLIPAYNLEMGSTYFFCSQDHEVETKEYRDYYSKDVCRATSAAPSYFEPARIRNANKDFYPFIDGGVFANNPTLCAIAEVGKAIGSFTPKEMFVLSLGTGRVQQSYSFNRFRKAIALLIIPDLINIMMDGVSETTHYITKKLFNNLQVGDQYVRLDPTLTNTKVAQMDNASVENISQLKAIGLTIVEEQDAELTRIAQILIGAEGKRGVVAPQQQGLKFSVA
jgi:uncharacterized protein